MTLRRLMIPVLILSLTACSGGADSPEASGQAADTPEAAAAATLQQMLEVARAGDWHAYVDRFYGEKDKFRSPQDMDSLAARFRDQWGDRVLQALEQAASVAPEIEGDQAHFIVAGQTVFTLFRGSDGGWSFHL